MHHMYWPGCVRGSRDWPLRQAVCVAASVAAAAHAAPVAESSLSECTSLAPVGSSSMQQKHMLECTRVRVHKAQDPGGLQGAEAAGAAGLRSTHAGFQAGFLEHSACVASTNLLPSSSSSILQPSSSSILQSSSSDQHASAPCAAFPAKQHLAHQRRALSVTKLLHFLLLFSRTARQPACELLPQLQLKILVLLLLLLLHSRGL